jgi:hypothetical protein
VDAEVFSEEHAESVNIQTSDNISVPVPELKAVNVSDNSLNQNVCLLTVNWRHIVSTAGYELNQDYRSFTI